MSLKKQKGKSQKIADAIRAEIISGKIRPGDRLATFRELADRFSVSVRAVQRAVDILTAEDIVERKQNSGAFVKAKVLPDDDTVYFLVPHAGHITSTHDSSIVLRRLLYGATSGAASGQLVQLLPVSRVNVPSFRKYPEAIDWLTLERIPPGAKVFIGGIWYSPVIPYLIARGVRGVFLASQYECEYPETWQMIQDASWPILTLDRRVAIRNVVNYLFDCGRRRIAALKSFVNQPEHPFRLGFMDGYEAVSLPFSADFFRELKSQQSEGELQEIIASHWRKTNFDSLVLCNPGIINTAIETLQNQLGLSIPDDVAVISYCNLPDYMEMSVPVSAFDFPWVDIGREVVNVFNGTGRKPTEIRFHSSIIDRMKTGGRQTESQIKAILPELSFAQKESGVMV